MWRRVDSFSEDEKEGGGFFGLLSFSKGEKSTYQQSGGQQAKSHLEQQAQ